MSAALHDRAPAPGLADLRIRDDPTRRGMLLGAAARAVATGGCESSERDSPGGSGDAEKTRHLPPVGSFQVPTETRRLAVIDQVVLLEHVAALGVHACRRADRGAAARAGEPSPGRVGDGHRPRRTRQTSTSRP